MKSFQTLQALSEYVPNCIICAKPMQITIDGTLSALPNAPLKSRYDNSVRIMLELKDSVYQSTHKNLKLTINPETNDLIHGLEIVNRLTRDEIYVRKSCPTCHFKIITTCDVDKIKKLNRFPALTLQSEELHFTMKGGKDLQIHKSYFEGMDESQIRNARIQLNHRLLPPMPVEFDKFTGFEHLVKRINTIVVFH